MMIRCCICGKRIPQNESNNPAPYMDEGRCCSECNAKHVIPARIQSLTTKRESK